MQIQDDWPLAPSPDQQTAQLLAALTVALRYDRLGSTKARSAIVHLQERVRIAPVWAGALAAITAGSRWEALSIISQVTADWSPEDRDYTGLTLVLEDGFVSTADVSDSPALYWRTVDTCLDAIGCQFTTHEVIDQTNTMAERLLEEAKSDIHALATSEDLITFLSLAHAAQAAVTGIYIRDAVDVLRWGQRKLDKVGDGELAFALAGEVAQLRVLATGGRASKVREYGELLGADILKMSTSRAHGRPEDRVTKQLRMFTFVLDVVAELLEQGDQHLGGDTAPQFEGMRLSEAYTLAAAHAIELVHIDGQRTAEAGDRGVWNTENWHVKVQAPRPGDALPSQRQVVCWVLKRGEFLSNVQRHESKRKTSAQTPGQCVSPEATDVSGSDSPHYRPLEFQPLLLARALAASWGTELVEHDGRGESAHRDSLRAADPSAWYVRKQVPDAANPSAVHVWALMRGESNLTVSQANEYFAMLKAAQAQGTQT